MSEQIKRYTCNYGPDAGMFVEDEEGEAVLYSDHLAARSADIVEIDRLRAVVAHLEETGKHWQERAEKAESSISELEASHAQCMIFGGGVVDQPLCLCQNPDSKVKQADSQVNDSGLNSKYDEAVRRDAERYTMWISFRDGVVWNIGPTRNDVETGAEIVRQYREVSPAEIAANGAQG